MFCKGIMTWKALRHPDALPLIGATMTGTQLAMVSEWMPNGNINEFLRAHPDADQLELVRGPFSVSSSLRVHRQSDDFPSLGTSLEG